MGPGGGVGVGAGCVDILSWRIIYCCLLLFLSHGFVHHVSCTPFTGTWSRARTIPCPHHHRATCTVQQSLRRTRNNARDARDVKWRHATTCTQKIRGTQGHVRIATPVRQAACLGSQSVGILTLTCLPRFGCARVDCSRESDCCCLWPRACVLVAACQQWNPWECRPRTTCQEHAQISISSLSSPNKYTTVLSCTCYLVCVWPFPTGSVSCLSVLHLYSSTCTRVPVPIVQ